MRKYTLLAAAIFLALVFLVFRDEIFDLSQVSIANDGDQRLNFLFMQWTLNWLMGSVSPLTASVFDYVIFYPYRLSLALSSNHLGSIPHNLILQIFTQDWFTRGNLWIYSCYFLNGMTAFFFTFLFLREWDSKILNPYQRFLAALLVGLSFGFSMTRVHYIEHSQTLPSYTMPAFLFFAFRACKSNHWKDVLIAGFLFSWQFYLDLHLAIFIVMLSSVLAVLYIIGLLYRKDLATLKSFLLLSVPIFILVVAVLCLPLAYPYIETVRIFGDRGHDIIGPREGNYFQPPVMFELYSGLFSKFTYNEGAVLPSMLFFPMFFAIIIISLWSTFRSIWLLAKKQYENAGIHLWRLTMCVPIILLLDVITHRSPISKFLRMVIPGLTSIRTPGRFSILTLAVISLTLIILVVRAGWPLKFPKLFNSICIVGMLFLITEVSTANFGHWQKKPLTNYRSLFSELSGPLIVLPVQRDNYSIVDLMQAAVETNTKIGNGYSGFSLPSLDQLQGYESSIPPEDLIKRLDVTYGQIVFEKSRWQGPQHYEFIRNNYKPGEWFETDHFFVLTSNWTSPKDWTVKSNWQDIDSYFDPDFLRSNIANFTADRQCQECEEGAIPNSGESRQ